MAIVAHTPYSKQHDCQRTNEYISDGHGNAVGRTNRYLTDGHGENTLCIGYNCPSDPFLATEYMKILRQNYERQHPPNPASKKKPVTHMQLYVSPTAEDNVPVDERLEMTRELIERTKLREFASIYCPHDNTPDKHCHISLCPYSIPDEAGNSHKLCMNNRLLNDLRREMDYICVEHGYSIVENPALWDNKEYRDWFFSIKERGIVNIHPPKDHNPEWDKGHKRARRYAASKKSQENLKRQQRELYKAITKGYSPETAEYFYTSPYLYDPSDPGHALHIKKFDKNQNQLSELGQIAMSQFVWAYKSNLNLKSRKIPGSQGLEKRLAALSDRAFNCFDLLKKLDIRTLDELVVHTKQCGQDIAELKQDIARQSTILAKLTPLIDAVDRWENQLDDEAHAYLVSQNCADPNEIINLKRKHARALARKMVNETLLTERSAEYRHLKEAESLLRPASSRDEWHDYLGMMFSREIQKKIGYVDPFILDARLHRMGKAIGFTGDEVDNLITKAKHTAAQTTWVEYRDFMRIVFTGDENGMISAVYEDIRQCYSDIRHLRCMQNDIPVLGIFTLLLAFAIGFFAGYEICMKEQELEELKWTAEVLKALEKRERQDKLEQLDAARRIYALEVINASDKEIEAAKNRFYAQAAQIVGSMVPLQDRYELKPDGTLTSLIEGADARNSEHTSKTTAWKNSPDYGPFKIR